MKLIKKCNPFALDKYVQETNNTDFIGWEWAKRFAKNHKNMKLKSSNHHKFEV